MRAAPGFPAFAFIAEAVTAEIGERLSAAPQRFAQGLWYGALAPPVLDGVAWAWADLIPPQGGIAFDEERLPFHTQSLGLYVSVLSLHAVNDLPGALAQIRRALKPSGLFVAAMFGGETLHELKIALAEAEIEIEGGLSPRVSPFVDVRDAGALLQRAGFEKPVADVDRLCVHYQHPLKLLADLKGMGETNVLMERRRRFLKRRVLARACEIYLEKFAGADGRVPATFDIVYLTGSAGA